MLKNRIRTKELDYLKLNSQGFEGSLKNQVMAENEGGKEMSSVETEPQTRRIMLGSVLQISWTAMLLRMMHCWPNRRSKPQWRQRHMRKKRLSDQITIQKKLRLLDQLEPENQQLWDELSSVTEESEVGAPRACCEHRLVVSGSTAQDLASWKANATGRRHRWPRSSRMLPLPSQKRQWLLAIWGKTWPWTRRLTEP